MESAKIIKDWLILLKCPKEEILLTKFYIFNECLDFFNIE
jgi:hypothetical protein